MIIINFTSGIMLNLDYTSAIEKKGALELNAHLIGGQTISIPFKNEKLRDEGYNEILRIYSNSKTI